MLIASLLRKKSLGVFMEMESQTWMSCLKTTSGSKSIWQIVLKKWAWEKKLISWNSSWTFYEENGNVNVNPNLELQTWFDFIFCAVHYQQCFRWGKKNCCCVLFLLLIASLLRGEKKTLGVIIPENGIPILN